MSSLSQDVENEGLGRFRRGSGDREGPTFWCECHRENVRRSSFVFVAHIIYIPIYAVFCLFLCSECVKIQVYTSYTSHHIKPNFDETRNLTYETGFFCLFQ